MAVMRKMTTLLVASLAESERAVLIQLLESWKLRLYTPKDGKKMTLAHCWKKSRWGRPEWIVIFRNIEVIVSLLKDDEHKAKV